MTPSPTIPTPRGRWLALTAALLGWMFDGLEMGLFPLVARPALGELLGTTDPTVVSRWLAIITAGFLVGAATGGVLFGWLGDRIGRVRAMTLSILTYAIFSGLCGLSQDEYQMAAYRFIAALGMGGEWSLGVALVMELWPNRSRAWLAGVIGAAANFGFMAIALAGLALTALITDLHAFLLAVGVGDETSAMLVSHSGWRILMLFGAAPAVLTFFIRLFVPESHRWQDERRRGATSHWATRDLVGVLIGALAACGLIALWATDLDWSTRAAGSLLALAVITLGYLYPIYRYLQRAEPTTGTVAVSTRATLGRMLLAAALSGVPLLATWGSVQWAPTWAGELTKGAVPGAKEYTQIAASVGAIVGCVLAALMGEWIGRRWAYVLMCVGSFATVFGFYRLNTEYGPAFLASAFLLGAVTAAFYGWLPLYLPELFRTKVRATGQGFGYNFGRVLAAIGVLQVQPIMQAFGGGYPVACSSMALIYLVGVGIIWLAPETKGKPLPE